MNTHFIKTEGRDVLILKVSGNLYLDGHEGDDIQVQVNPRDLKVIKDADNLLRVTCYSNCSISVPEQFKTRVEKVGGSGVINGMHCEDLYVQRVGGNLNIQNVDNLTLSRVGGSCQIKDVVGSVNVERVSGDLYVFDVKQAITINTARSDAIVMMARDAVTASSNGDMVVQYVGEEIQPMNLRSKGNITLLLPKNANANLDATFSGWDIVMTMDGKTNNYGGGHHEAVLGEGGSLISLQTSGDIVVSDEHQGVVKEVQDEFGSDWLVDFDAFDLEYDESDAYDRRIRRAMDRLESRLSKAEGKMNSASQKMIDNKSNIATRIEERAMRRAERAEKLAEVKIKKRAYQDGIEALKEAKEQLKDLKLPIDLPPLDFLQDIEIPEIPVVDLREFDLPEVPPVPPVRAEKAKPKASREERMMILEMVREGTISIDEAEKLLSALNE